MLDAAEQLASDVIAFLHDPAAFVRYIYPWGERELEAHAGPRGWQQRILELVGAHFSNPATRFEPLLIAVSSGHGIGKSALMAMLSHWALSTCEDSKIVITANNDTQLNTKTWPEISRWFRLALNRMWFDVKAESVSVRDPGHERTWRMDRVPWSVHHPEAFSGLHNQGKRIVLLMDECSGIPDVIWDTAEGALTDEETEILWLVFGNPTKPSGRFRECFGRFAHRWHHFHIDAREVPGTNKAQFERWVADYGEDSDFVRVKVRGQFPRTGLEQFVPSEAIELCRKYKAQGYAALAKILSCDVARFGDDRSVLGWRQGRKFKVLGKWRGLDTVQLAERTIAAIGEEQPDAIVVDGDGIGAGVVDQIRYRGYQRRLFEFHGGEAANDAAKYFNRRAEVWGLMRDWLVAGAEIPDDPEIELDLAGPQYAFSAKGQIQLEKKEDMKARGLASPDIADCLAMSFSVKVAAPKPPEKPTLVYPGRQAQSWMG